MEANRTACFEAELPFLIMPQLYHILVIPSCKSSALQDPLNGGTEPLLKTDHSREPNPTPIC